MKKNGILITIFLSALTLSTCHAQLTSSQVTPVVKQVSIVTRQPVTLVSHNKMDTVFTGGVSEPKYWISHSKMLMCRDTLDQLISFNYFDEEVWQLLKRIVMRDNSEIVFDTEVEMKEDGEKSYRLISYTYKEK